MKIPILTHEEFDRQIYEALHPSAAKPDRKEALKRLQEVAGVQPKVENG